MKFFLLINVKMPTIVGILTFMSGTNCILGLSDAKTAEFLDIFILMSIYNFMLEHAKSFIASGPGITKQRIALLGGKYIMLRIQLLFSMIALFVRKELLYSSISKS